MPAEYIRQTQISDDGERREWFRAAQADAAAEGMAWFRFSVHPQHSDLLLIEGWRARPKNEGPQTWSLQEERTNA